MSLKRFFILYKICFLNDEFKGLKKKKKKKKKK